MSLRSFFFRPMSPAALERMRHIASEITAAGLTMDCACPACSTDAAELKRAMGELRSGFEVLAAQVLLTNTARATRQAMLRVATVLGAMEVFHFHRAMAEGLANVADISAEAARAAAATEPKDGNPR